MSNCTLEHCWDELPAPCLQAIAANLTPQDSLSARLTCSTWANSTPLPQISLSLTVTPSGISCEGLAEIKALLIAQQQSKKALGAVRCIVLSLTLASNACTCTTVCALKREQPSAACIGSQQQQDPQHQQAHGARCTMQQQRTPRGDNSSQLLAQVLAFLPSFTSAVISIQKPKQQHDILLHRMMNLRSSCSPTSSSREATIEDCHTVMLQLLALPQLQQQLSSLSLACEGIWPNHQQLVTALRGIKHLTTLQLLNCPISALTRLPSLLQLKQLAVSGRLLEPVPRSYSARSLPLLPQLPQLRQLSIRQMPYDVQRQEELDIYCCLLQQQRAAAAAAGAGSPHHATGDSSSSSSSSLDAQGQQQQQQHAVYAPKDLSRVTDWRAVQWVTSSIKQQCPNLVQLNSDMALGQGLTQMQQLEVLAAPACSSSPKACVPTTRCAQLSRAAAVSAASGGNSAGGNAGCAAIGAAENGNGGSSSSKCGGATECTAVLEAGLGNSAWCCCQQRVLCSCCS